MMLYIKYSKEHPYLPVAVADSTEELAEMIGTTVNVVRSSLSHGRGTYHKIVIDDSDDAKT